MLWAAKFLDVWERGQGRSLRHQAQLYVVATRREVPAEAPVGLSNGQVGRRRKRGRGEWLASVVGALPCGGAAGRRRKGAGRAARDVVDTLAERLARADPQSDARLAPAWAVGGYLQETIVDFLRHSQVALTQRTRALAIRADHLTLAQATRARDFGVKRLIH